MVAPFLITMKTWDYYGWKPAFLAATVTAVSAFKRIADGSHYPSDVMIAAVLSFSAHWATGPLGAKAANRTTISIAASVPWRWTA